jgi:putative transposase
MTYNQDKHHRSVWPPDRRSIRLKGYDYSQSGAYFVTICIQDWDCSLGKIVNGEMQLNAAGQMIFDWWKGLPPKYTDIELDEFIIMPNHLHGIIILYDNVGASLVDAQNNGNSITMQNMIPNINPDESMNNIHLNNNRAGTRPAPTNIGLGDVNGSIKSITTNEYIKGVQNLNCRHSTNVYGNEIFTPVPIYIGKHIVRDENELNRI